MNCKNCKHASISGGMEGYAETVGKKVENLQYRYCIAHHDHVYLNRADDCTQFIQKPNVPIPNK
jgi:hypothetical protein